MADTPLLPDNPLPETELDGQLGGSSRSLVLEINALRTRFLAAEADIDALQAASSADDADDTAIAETLGAAIAAVDGKIATAQAETLAALASEFATLSAAVETAAAGQAEETATLVASVESSLTAAIAETGAGAAESLAAEVAAFNAALSAGLSESSSTAAALVASAQAEFTADVAEAEANAAAALASEVVGLNERIGVEKKITTAVVGPTVIDSFEPSPFEVSRVVARVVAARSDRLEAAAYLITALCRAVPSSDVLTLAVAVPSDGETVTLGAQVYTWRADPTGIPYAVDIGVDFETSIDNLVAAIMGTGTDDVEYGAGTVANPDVAALKASATTMEAIARTPGVAGDALAATETMVNGSFGGGGTLGGGSDMTVFGKSVVTEHEDAGAAAWDVDIVANLAAVEITGLGELDKPIEWVSSRTVVEIL